MFYVSICKPRFCTLKETGKTTPNLWSYQLLNHKEENQKKTHAKLIIIGFFNANGQNVSKGSKTYLKLIALPSHGGVGSTVKACAASMPAVLAAATGMPAASKQLWNDPCWLPKSLT